MPGRRSADPCVAVMLKSQLKFPGAGDDSILLVLSLPGEFISLDAPACCMSIPVMSREGGILLAIPSDYIVPHALLDSAVSHDEDTLIGPYAEFEASLLEEDEEGNVERVPEKSRYLAIDFSDDILGYLRQYDPVTDPSAVIRPFDPERLEAIVDVKESLEDIRRWLESLGDVPRANFHSAREEPPTPKAAPKKTAKRVTAANLAVQVETLTAQVKMMAKQQQEMLLSHRASVATQAAELPNGGHVAPRLPDASAGLGAPQMPSVPKVAQLVGPPPKTKAIATSAANPAIPDTGEALEDMEMQPDPMSRVLLQQSAALSTLVAHLTTGDALTDLSAATSSGAGLSTKGVARRERLQQELSAGTSNFFVQVQQQLFRKLSPSKPLPKTEEDLMLGGASMCEYLEKFGGYKTRPEMGMLMWLLAHMMDSAQAGDHRMMKEFLALTVVCVEQSVLDGDWNLAYVLSLLEEPPHHVFSEKPVRVSSLGRPAAPQRPKANFQNKYCRRSLCSSPKLKVASEPTVQAPPHGGVSSVPEFSYLHESQHRQSSRFESEQNVPRQGDNATGCSNFDALAGQKLTHPKWCAELTSQVLRSKTPFAAYLHRTIQLSRSSRVNRRATPTFFPIPLPMFGLYGRMPYSSSAKVRHTVHESRALHVIVSASIIGTHRVVMETWNYLGGSPVHAMRLSSSVSGSF